MSALRRYYTALSRYRRGKGFGIHSPFAFHFVLRVLKERAAYYFYDDIDECRQLASAGRSRMKGRKRPLVSRKNARLLFRIVNCFQPSAVLAFGSSYGVSSRVILGVSRKTHLWLCEPAELMPMVAEVLGGEMRRVTAGECAGELIGQAAQEMGECPFVVVDYLRDEDIPPVAAYLGQIVGGEAVVVVRNLSQSQLSQELWEGMKGRMAHGMTFSNGKIAVAVVRRKLPLHHYQIWF